jgi:hypothetical protein
MKNKTPKPLVMWANPSEFTDITFLVDKRKSDVADWSAPNDPSPIRVAIIPLDDMEAIVERAAMACGFGFENTRIALTAAGIPCTKRKARK